MGEDAPPTRSEVRAKLVELAGGSAAPEDIDAWAYGVIRLNAERGLAWIDDDVVWDGLMLLHGADLQIAPHQYLYGPEDYRAWVDEFDEAARGKRRC